MENASDAPKGAEPAGGWRAGSGDPADESDQRLLAAAAQGDDRAFAVLYRRYAPLVYNYLLRLIHDQNLAEDLLQETFVAAWRGAGAFKGRSGVKTWLFRIAHNRAVSWLRRHRPHSMNEDLELADEAPGPEALSLLNWRNEALLAALDALSTNHRAVIELVFVHELTYSDIARIIECPVGTVKSRMSYALKHLNRLLSGADVG